MVPSLSRSTAKSPLLHEPKLLPPEPTASNQSEEDEDEDEEEEEEEDFLSSFASFGLTET